MAFLKSLNISGSALTAQKLRMDVISQNISNASVTRTEDGGPYRRKLVVFRENTETGEFSDLLDGLGAQQPAGVVISDIAEDASEGKPVYNPDHPDADENGYVMMPNVNTVEEMIDMMSATRSYQANITAFNAVKLMAAKALEIGR